MAENLEGQFAEYRRSGDPGVLGRVFDAVAPELYHVALHLSGDPSDAEDILQATCLAAIEGAARWDPARPLKPWLLGILANQSRLFRSRNERRPDPERLTEREPTDPSVDAEHDELLLELERALLRIPVANRSVLVLRLKHGLTIGEIAESLARPPGTVRSQLARGLEILRRTLPASLAGAVAALMTRPARGLSAVRHSVLARAAALQPAASAIPPLAGLLIMKKLLIALGLLIAGFGTLFVVREQRAAPIVAGRLKLEPVHAATRPAPEIVLDDSSRHAIEVPRPEAGFNPTVGSVASASTATLLIEARWQETGEPASGARVTARSLSSSLSYPDERHAQTDTQGRARIDGVVPGTVEVGALRSRIVVRSVSAGGVLSVELELLSGVDVEGVVVSKDGDPVVGASIWMSERFRWDRGQVVGMTDVRGHFHVDAIGPDQQIGAQHPDFAASYLQNAVGVEDSIALRIVLEGRGVTLRGRVLAHDGRPLDRALVLVGDDRWSEVALADGRTTTHAPPLMALTDASGAFELPSVPPGPATVRARAQGFGTTARFIEVNAGGGAYLELVLIPEASVSGHVSAASGEPVGGAVIESLGASRFEISRTKTSADGSFTLRGLSPGELELLATHAVHGRADTLLALAAGQAARWDVALEAVPSVFGTLLDPGGAPLGDHGVILKRQGEHVVRVETDADGRFAISGLEDLTYTLQVKEPGNWRRFPVLVLPGVRPGFEPLELRLRPRAEYAVISGFVRGPRNAVLEDAVVTLWQEPDKLWRRVPASAEDGAFSIDEIPPGTCYVTATAAGFPDLRLPEHEVASGERLEVGTLLLDEPARIAGTLTVVDATSLEALTLELYEGTELLDETVHRDGRRFRSQPLGAGTYQLIARGDGLRSLHTEVRIHAGEEIERTLALEAAPTREVVLERPVAARMPRRVLCRLEDAAGEVVWMRTLKPKDDGLHLTVSAAAGTYRFRAVTNNGLFGVGRIRIGPTTATADAVLIPLLRSGDQD